MTTTPKSGAISGKGTQRAESDPGDGFANDLGLDDVLAEGWSGGDTGGPDFELADEQPTAPAPPSASAARQSEPPVEGAFDEAESLAEFEGVTSALDELKGAGINVERSPSSAGIAPSSAEDDPYADDEIDQALDASFTPAPQMLSLDYDSSQGPAAGAEVPIDVAAKQGPFSPHQPDRSMMHRWSKVILAVMVIVGLTVVGVTYILVLSGPSTNQETTTGQPQLILVEGTVEGGEGASVLRTSKQGSAPAPPPIVPVIAADAAPEVEAAPSPGQEITLAFGRQRERITACFEEHALAVEGTPRIDIELTISTAGAVRGVSVLPEPISDSPLGRCLSAIALSTRFPRQEHAISVSIPIQARVVP